MHIGPISDLKQIWRAGGIETHDESLSAHCGASRSCARSLQVLTPHNAMTLDDDMTPSLLASSKSPVSSVSLAVR